MGRPGRLDVRIGTKGSGGQLSIVNYNAQFLAQTLANALKTDIQQDTNSNDGNNSNLKSNKLNKSKHPIFDNNGHITLESISARREFFLGKSIGRLEHELHKYGYITERRKSTRPGSKAKITIVINTLKERNIGQLQVSSGSKRHGNIPYVKISTKDIGKIKIIAADENQYKTDGHETAILLFRRKK